MTEIQYRPKRKSSVGSGSAFRIGIDPLPEWYEDYVIENPDEIVFRPGKGREGRIMAEVHSEDGVENVTYGDYICRDQSGHIHYVSPEEFEEAYEEEK